jgi:hypothetical protein
VGFDALIKRWDKCINTVGGYVEKYFFQFQISHVLRFECICDLFTDSPLYDAKLLSNAVRLETTEHTAIAV